ncbi:MAG: hypothetical protein QGD91_12085 [Actinomycetota bacterium]|nr:hypothetical protein [Actinomycetota bacterium]
MTGAMTKNAAWMNAKAWRRHGEEADEPCQYGHLGCSCSGEDGGPCMNESFSTLEALGIDPGDA